MPQYEPVSLSNRHQHRALEVDHDLVALIQAARATVTIPGRAATGLALREDLGLGADRVAREDRRRQRTSRQPRLTARSETSTTERPVTSASVNVESTSGYSHSVSAAYAASKWIGFVFSVSSVNQTLSASSTVRPKRLR